MADTSTIAQHNAAVDGALRGLLAGRDLPLYRMMAYQLGWTDERGELLDLRPPPRLLGALVLEVAAAVGAPEGVALPHAAAVELLLNSCQIHEDVAEGDLERRGRASVLGAWGLAQATNAGDGMYAVARLALLALPTRGAPPEAAAACLAVLDDAAAQLSEGGDTVGTRQRALDDADTYLQAVRRRDGALAGCAARLGALAAGEVPGADVGQLGEFGVAIGAARRVTGDIAEPAPTPARSRGTAFAEQTIERLLRNADAALSRTGLCEHAVPRLRRFADEFVRVPAE